MTRRGLALWIGVILTYVLALILLGLALSGWGTKPENEAYKVFKDLIPLQLAIPAAWIGVLFQKRASFLASARALYEAAVKAIHQAVDYTYLSPPKLKDYVNTRREIEITMDLFRGTFHEVKVGDNRYYPFETLAEIHYNIFELGYESSFRGKEAAEKSREYYKRSWREQLRPVLLAELDRHVPSAVDSWMLRGSRQTTETAKATLKALAPWGVDGREIEDIVRRHTNPFSRHRFEILWLRIKAKMARRRLLKTQREMEKLGSYRSSDFRGGTGDA